MKKIIIRSLSSDSSVTFNVDHPEIEEVLILVERIPDISKVFTNDGKSLILVADSIEAEL